MRLSCKTIAEAKIWSYYDWVKISAHFHIKIVTSETAQRCIWVNPIVWQMGQELGPKSVINPAVAVLVED